MAEAGNFQPEDFQTDFEPAEFKWFEFTPTLRKWKEISFKEYEQWIEAMEVGLEVFEGYKVAEIAIPAGTL